jgi:hypothetical protein
MNATPNAVVEDEPRPRRPISLWNLQENLTKLAEELAEAARRFDAAADNDSDPQTALEAMSPRQYFTSLLELRRTRERYFGSELFGEPAWDIMLELMLARVEDREVLASELQSHASTPAIVTRHYLEALVDARLVDTFENAANVDDPCICLSSEAARRMAELYRARTRG